MSWLEALLDQIEREPVCGYHVGSLAAVEPTAWNGLALHAAGRTKSAETVAGWLTLCQAESGAVGVRLGETDPPWPTSLAVMLWHATATHADKVERAVKWIQAFHGETMPRHPEMGHDSTLMAWPWIAGTHAWLEPTALFTAALKLVGEGEHARTREAVRVLFDRLLPDGGCNYGNTTVLGQELRPHIQPTGLVMLALANEGNVDSRLEKSLRYLEQNLHAETATASLCYGLIGLTVHARRPQDADAWLETAYQRVLRRDRAPYKFALIAAAAMGSRLAMLSNTATETPRKESETTS